MAALSLRIADAVLELDAASNIQLGVDPPMQAFACTGARADIQFRVERRDLSGKRPGKLLFDSGALWRLYADKNECELRMTTPALGEIPYKIARFDAKFERGTIQIHTGYPTYFPEGAPLDPLEYPLGELIYLHWLSQGRGIEVHSCGLVDANGDGILMVGHSGAGKTTSAELWLQDPAVEVLSDDRIILRQKGDEIWMYGTPWHGTGYLSSPRQARLKSILFLRHAARNAIVPMRDSLAATRLLACSFVPLHQREGLANSVKFLQQVTARVPCADLDFTPDLGVVGFVRRAIAQGPLPLTRPTPGSGLATAANARRIARSMARVS